MRYRAMLLILMLGCGSAFADAPPALPKTALPKTVVPSDDNNRAHPEWNQLAARNLAAAKGKPCDILFVGDSITQNFATAPTKTWDLVGKPVWDKYYGQRHAVNFGVGADKTQNVLWRLETMDIAAVGQPKVVVILIGINNAKDSAADITSGIKAVLAKTQSLFKDAKFILVSVTPSNREPAKFAQVNDAIKAFADDKTVYFLDLFAQMPPAGTNYKGVGRDHVHLTNEGYELWASAMEPLLVKLLKE